MADQKVSDLPSLNGADVDAADLLYIIDSSAGTAGSKKITVGQYQVAPYSAGTANGVMYLNGSNVVTTGSALTFDGTNLGIGTSSPGVKLDVASSSGSLARFTRGSIQLSAFIGASEAFWGTDTNTPLAFTTNGTEKMRLDASGNLLVGTTTALSARRGIQVLSPTGTYVAGSFANDSGSTAQTIETWNKATTGNNSFVSFATEATFTERGQITYNRAGGLVAYNTTSDYRAKDILGPVANPGATIDALKVYEGRMKGATQSRPMLVAHEAQAVAPYSVTGEKDAVNEDGTPKFQQMDVSSLVPLLLAEIQSLRARVAALESQ